MTGANEFSTERLRMRKYRMDDALIIYEKFGSMKAMQKEGMQQIASEKNALEIDGNTFDKIIYRFSAH